LALPQIPRPNPFLPEKKPGINDPGSCEAFLQVGKKFMATVPVLRSSPATEDGSLTQGGKLHL